MLTDKYSAIWVSHSSISDFLKCPRSYYLKNVYKDPKTNHKITIINPHLALGQVVHEVIECLYKLKAEERFKNGLMDNFEECWIKVTGKLGGFRNMDEEMDFKQRGEEMIKRVIENPGPLLNKATRIKGELPNCYLSKESNIILCGKIDWLEYNEDDDSVNIIDFKTGKHEEDGDSLQLPIYFLLASMCQKRRVKSIRYWYLDQEIGLVEKDLPDYELSYQRVLDIAKLIKKAREERNFTCKKNGCFHCRDFEAILDGKGEFVGCDNYRRDIYILS